MIFKNRLDAAQKLAESLKKYENQNDVLILGLARGGVILAAEIARILNVPFDLVMTRKIGAPFNPELAVGAITETGEGYFNDALIQTLGISKNQIEEIVALEKKEAERQRALYQKDREVPSIKEKTVILVDDGIATGATMMAAVLSSRKAGAKKIVIAVPVASPEALEFLNSAADQMICLDTPPDFMGVSQFYEEFPQVEDSEILSLLI